MIAEKNEEIKKNSKQNKNEEKQILKLDSEQIKQITKNNELAKKLSCMKSIKQYVEILRDFDLKQEEFDEIFEQKEIQENLTQNEKILIEKIREN